MQIRLSIVIPAFNESGRLPPSLERIGSFLADNPNWLPAEIIVVDDGSKDGTAESARSAKLLSEIDLRIANHPKNLGKGAAVRTGFGLSMGKWVLLTDADLSTPIEELPLLARAAEDDGVAIGSRAVQRRLVEVRQPRHRDFMGRTFNLVVRTLGLSKIHDTQCGFKLFPGNLARDLAVVQRLDGFAYDVELLVIARSWGYPIHEVGVRWRHIEASRVFAVRHSAQMLRDLLRLWWWRATGEVPQPTKDSP
jgi:dolichyl-phosphate beta-glucosyltransferase